MVTMHFVRTLAVFTVLIALGLGGVYLVNKYGEEAASTAGPAPTECVGEEC